MRFFLLGLVTLALAQTASAYTYIYDSTTHQPIKWRPALITMHLELGTAPTTLDTDFNHAVLSAINIWNSNLSAIQLNGVIDSAAQGDGNNTNELFFAPTIYGGTFGGSTLAVTTTWSFNNNSRGESDIVFNNNPTLLISGTTYNLQWDSYRGNQKFIGGSPVTLVVDIRRVALHELGHALGLDHPDQATDGSVEDPNNKPIMHSSIGDLDHLIADDIAGAQHLYGMSGGAAPSNDNFANAALITQSDGTTYTGSNIYTNAANRQSGEPLIVGNPGGHSVWWKWVAPTSGTTTIDTRGSYFDTIMGVYTGSAINSLSLVVENDDELISAPSTYSPSHTSLVTFNAVGGTTYYIAVDGWYDSYSASLVYHVAGDTGDIKLHVNQAAAPPANGISFNSSTFPSGGVAPGSTVSFTYNVTNSGSQAWGVNHYLVLKDGSHTNLSYAALNGVASGGSSAPGFTFTAPATAGTYTYYVQALENGVAYFGTEVPLTLTVTGPPPNAITYNSTTFPSGGVAAGSTVSFTYNVTNVGTQAWGSNHTLQFKDPSHAVLQQGFLNGVAVNGSITLSYSFTAPATPGTYTYYLQAQQSLVGNFGPEVPLTLTVSGVPANAITYNSTTFPSSVFTQATVSFSYNVTNSGAQAWGVNHFLVLKDSSHNSLQQAALNGVAANASTNASITFTAPSTAGTYTYYVQAIQNGSGYFGAEVPLTLVVSQGILPPPFVQNWPVQPTGISGSGFSLTSGDPGLGGPFTYQWYKDGVPIAGATGPTYTKSGATTQADAGNYAIMISNASGVIMSPDMPVVWYTYTTPWVDVGRVGDVVYFLYNSPGVISRYDLAAETWLPQVTLSGTPTAFVPTAEGVFIAYGTSLKRRTVDLQGETAVGTSATTINRLLAYGNLVYFLNGSNVASYNRSSLTAGPGFAPGFWSSNSEWSQITETTFSSTLGRGYFVRSATPSDVIQFTIAGDGTFNSEVDTPYHGDFRNGQHLYLSPDQQLLIDSSGVAYNTSDLTYARSLGQSFEDLTFLSDGTPVILRDTKLLSLNPDNFTENGRVALTGQNYRAFSRSVTTYVFGAPAVTQGNPSVTKVAQSAFSPLATPAAYNPSAAHFSTDDMFMDPNGVIHVLSRSARSVVRWSAPSRNFLSSLPLRGSPAFSSYASGANRLVLNYEDGTQTQFNFGTNTTEAAFGEISNPVFGMVAMDDLQVCNLSQVQTSGDIRLVLNSSGTKMFLSGQSYWGRVLAWQSVTRRLYSYAQYSITYGLAFEDVPSTGVLPTPVGSYSGLNPPLRPNQDGSRVLTVAGQVLDSSLGPVATLANSVIDGAWLPGGLFTIRALGNGVQLQKWGASSAFGLLGTLNLPGLPLRIFRLDDSTVVAVTSVNGYLAFHTVTSGLTLTNSTVNDHVVVPNALTYNSTTFPATAPAGSTVNFTYNVTNAGSNTWGANHFLALRQFDYTMVQLGALSTTASGDSKAVAYSFTAPSTPGTYQYRVQPLENGVAWFGTEIFLTLTVTAPLPPANGLTYNNTNFPATAPAGSTVNFTYNVTNSGTKIWGANHLLALRQFDYTIVQLSALGTTAVSGTKAVTYSFTAPSVQGTYQYRVQPLENGVEWFGTEIFLTLTVTAPLPPANGLTYNTTNFPTTVTAGATVNFTYNVTNSGTKIWGANHDLALRQFDYTMVQMGALGTTAVSGTKAVAYSFTAPSSPGTYQYRVQPLENGVEWFGSEIILNLTVTAAPPPVNGLTYNTNDFPATVSAGATVNFTYNVTNSGTKTWAANHFLALRQFDYTMIQLGVLATTAASGSKAVAYSFTAPSTPGIYQYRIQPLENGVEWFGTEVILTLNVGGVGPQINGLTYGSTTFPASASPGATVNFTYNVTNSGTKTWASNHYLALRQFDYAIVQMGALATTAASGSKAVAYSFTAPSTPGIYQYRIQPLENGVEWFGSEIILTLNVGGVGPQVNGLTYGSTTFPANASPGATVNFTYNVTNSGTKTWASNHFLALRQFDYTMIQLGALATTAASGTKVVSYSFTAPSTPGIYQYRIQPLENGVEWFGTEVILTLNVGGVGPQVNGLTYGSHTFPSTVTAGSTVNFTYNVTNSGSKAWGSNHLLALRKFDYTIVQMGALGTTAAAGSKAVTYSFTAPATPGTYQYRVQPLENGVEWFGSEVILTLQVVSGLTAEEPTDTTTFSADFDGDGQTDLVWHDSTTGECEIWLLHDSTVVDIVDVGVMSLEWKLISTDDYDGDGRPDLVWQNTNTGEYCVWLMDGTTITTTVFTSLPNGR